MMIKELTAPSYARDTKLTHRWRYLIFLCRNKIFITSKKELEKLQKLTRIVTFTYVRNQNQCKVLDLISNIYRYDAFSFASIFLNP